MRVVRALRTGTVTGVVAWKLATLALLPAAFCCQAVLAADGPRACCNGKDHGDFCPLKQPDRSGAPDGPQLEACESFEDALIGLLSLTGFTPETSELQASLDAGDRIAAVANSAIALDRAPPLPPPRA